MKKSGNKKQKFSDGKQQGRISKPGKEVKPFLHKTPFLFYLIMILIPLLFFVLLEVLLRLFNYGYDYSMWADAGSAKYVINHDVPKRYFSGVEFVPTTSEDVFDQEKKPNAFRVFVLGESSAAGYPYMPAGAFSRYIRKRLEIAYPNTTIEVVNLSMTGISSYTLYDLLPGIIEQKPDLILIYTGHNEYYGALGVGSSESLGTSNTVVKFVLYLNRFKITQLVRNTLKSVTSIFSSGEKISGSLMSRMAKDQYIPMNSDKYKAGIEMFEENMRDILETAQKENVPVIISRLVSNLKDQKPFISVDSDGLENANEVYNRASVELKSGNTQKADSLFRLAKDLDALRFRAPDEINKIVDKLGKEFHVATVPADSVFNAESPDGIVGDNLMVDHLHPNVKGYQLIGKAFYEAMYKYGNLPKSETAAVEFEKQDSLTISNFVFTDLDSSMGNIIVALLKSDWPFVRNGTGVLSRNNFKPQNFIDSVAQQFTENKISWVDAHVSAAMYYLQRDDMENHMKHMNALLYQYPSLIDYKSAVRYFYTQNKLNINDFNEKRMGIAAVYIKQYDEAITMLTKSSQVNPGDAHTLYYLSLAYTEKKDYRTALDIINKCLDINPENPKAVLLRKQILQNTGG